MPAPSLTSKNKTTWYRILRDFKIPNTIQSREYSKDGGRDDILYILVRDPDGNLNVLVLNENVGKRNLNLNWFDNRWNRHYLFAGVRNLLYFLSLKAGVSFDNCFLQPPSIFPISFRCSEREIYFLLSSAFISQAT